MDITPILRSIAKAIVAAIMPAVVVAASWLLDNVGINVQIDLEALELAVLSVLTAVAVWAKGNTPLPVTVSED